MSQKELDRVTDKVLVYDPKRGDGPLKVIAGAPDRPLLIGDIEIPCYVLEDETRVLVQRGMASGMGMSSSSGQRIANFASSKGIKPFISNDLRVVIDNPIKFLSPGGVAHGYPATLLVEICNAVLFARDAGILAKQQEHIAHRCDVLIRSLAKVGVIALVDEATGYERIREENALAKILDRLIAEELNPWTKVFPFEFYEQICRLRGWSSMLSIKRPAIIGKYTNDFVYDRLAPGVLTELQRKNPVLPATKRRQHKHHQWLTLDTGHKELGRHLWAVIALMRAAPSWKSFKRSLDRALPKQNARFPSATGQSHSR